MADLINNTIQASETQRLSARARYMSETATPVFDKRSRGGELCARVLCDMRCLVAITFIFLAIFISIIIVGVTAADGVREKMGNPKDYRSGNKGRLRLSSKRRNSGQKRRPLCPTTPQNFTRDVDPELSWIVLDTDMGIDDAYALMLLLEAEKRYYDPKTQEGPRLLAVTCVNGNTNVDNVVINVLKVFNMTGRLDGSIPVYRGASKSLLKTNPGTNYFGVDGMGDLPDVPTPSLDHVDSTHAAVALVQLVNKHPDKITLLTIGPLTNIAMAIRLDEDFLKKLKHLIILGGSTEGRGNTVPGIEFNFWMDPEANYVVLQDAEYDNGKVSLLAWEAVEKMGILESWRKDQLGALSSPLIQFLNKAEDIVNSSAESWVYCDPVAAAVLLRPALVLRRDRHAVIPYTDGEARGGIAVDYYGALGSGHTVILYSDIQVEKYKTMMLDFFQ